jgi:hypothetical protein
MANALNDVLPGATQSQVGQWVESVATSSIVERNARIAEIERTGADPSSRPTAASVLSGGYSRIDELSASNLAEEPSSSSIKPRPRSSATGTGSQRLVPPAPPSARISATPAPPITGRTPLPDTGSRKNLVVPTGRPVAAEPSQPIVTASTSMFGAGPDTGRQTAPPPTISPDVFGPTSSPGSTTNPGFTPGRGTLPSLEPPAVPLELAKPAKITIQKLPGRKRTLAPYLWIVFGIGLFVLVVMSPELVRRRVIEAAAADGLTVAIDSVDISLKGMRVELKNVNVTNASLPGCSVHADVAVATLDGLAVSSVTLHNANIALDGTAPGVADAFTKWSAAHPDLHVLGGSPRFQIGNGRILWTGVLGPGTKAEGSGVVGDIARAQGRPLGADATFTFPALTLETPAGIIGPWRFEHSIEASATKTKVQLDPGAPGGPGFTITTAPGAPTVVDGKFSRARLGSVGLPFALLGQKPDDPTKLDLTLHAELTDQKLSGNVRIGLVEMRVGTLTPVDGAISGRFSGGRDGPIGIEEGLLTLGAYSAPLGGAITAGPDAFRLQLGGAMKGCGELQLVVDTKEPSKSGGGLSSKGCKPAK